MTKLIKKPNETKEKLIRAGTAILTEQGFASTGIDSILKQVKVPKGSFYYYFESKEDFGISIIKYYAQYFAKKLDQSLLNTDLSPLARIYDFYKHATLGMKKYQFRRGCLVGNLGQEITMLPDSFRSLLIETLNDWQYKMATCLKEAQKNEELAKHINCEELAEFFWIGWEGAVMRAKLMKNEQPLTLFIKQFLPSHTFM